MSGAGVSKLHQRLSNARGARRFAKIAGIAAALGISAAVSSGANSAHDTEAQQAKALHAEMDYKVVRSSCERQEYNVMAASAKRLAEKYPGNAEAVRWEAVAVDHSGAHEEAVVLFRKVIVLKPGDALAWLDLALAQEAGGHLKEAAASCQQALEHAPEDAEILVGAAEFYLRHGNKAMAQQLFAHAEKSLQHGHFEDHDGEYRREYAWHAIAWGYVQMGEPDEAVKADKHALGESSHDHFAWFVLGEALRAQEKYEKAVDAYSRAVKLVPSDAASWAGMADAYFAMHKTEAAADACRHAGGITPAPHGEAGSGEPKDYLDPLYAAPHFNACHALSLLGQICLEAKHYEEAAHAFALAAKADKSQPGAWNGLGWSYVGLKRYDDAIAAFEQATQLKAAYAEAWSGRGNAMAALGRRAAAVESYRSAVKYEATNAALWVYLGGAYDQSHQKKEAIAAYEKALKINPGEPHAKEALEADRVGKR